MSQYKTRTRADEKSIAYTNVFGEEMRIPYTHEDYEWRVSHPQYRNVRIETRTVIIEVITTDWKESA